MGKGKKEENFCFAKNRNQINQIKLNKLNKIIKLN